MARKPFMAGNWKMNLDHLEAIAHMQKVAFGLSDEDFEAVEVGVMVPFTDIRSVQTLVDADNLKIVYGSQDISAHDKGAYTGEISGSMLAKLGCSYATIGHSERRQYHGEDDALVNAKVKAAYSARPGADHVHRRGEGGARGRHPGAGDPGSARGRPGRHLRRAGWPRS